MDTRLIDTITSDTVKFFDLNAEAVFTLKVEYGCSYLESAFKDDPELIDALRAHPAFWMWWRELWAERDRELMIKTKKGNFGFAYLPGMTIRVIFQKHMWTFYEDYHDWRNVKQYPNTVMMNVVTKPLLVHQ